MVTYPQPTRRSLYTIIIPNRCSMQKCPYWCHTSLSSLFLAFGGRPQAHALFNVLYRWYFSLSLQKSNENAYDSQSNDDGLGGANKIRRVLSCIILPYDQPCVSMSLFMSVVVNCFFHPFQRIACDTDGIVRFVVHLPFVNAGDYYRQMAQ